MHVCDDQWMVWWAYFFVLLWPGRGFGTILLQYHLTALLLVVDIISRTILCCTNNNCMIKFFIFAVLDIIGHTTDKKLFYDVTYFCDHVQWMNSYNYYDVEDLTSILLQLTKIYLIKTDNALCTYINTIYHTVSKTEHPRNEENPQGWLSQGGTTRW